MARVDVVVPCYRYGHLLRECVESVLRQSVRDLRVLIIDNASPDNSVEVARQLAAEDSRVEVLARRTNLGPHASFNEGIDWARADFFTILCADDLLAPGALERAVSVLESNERIAFAYGRYLAVRGGEALPELAGPGASADWRVCSGREFIEGFCSRLVLTVSPVVRTSAQKQAGHYRPSLPFTDDLEILLRLALLGDVAETSAIQAVQRLHGSNISRASSHFGAEEDMFRSFFANEGKEIRGARRLENRALGNVVKHAYWSAVSHFCRGHVGKSWELIRFALSRRPSLAFLPPIDWLFCMGRPLARSAEVLAEALERLATAAKRLRPTTG